MVQQIKAAFAKSVDDDWRSKEDHQDKKLSASNRRKYVEARDQICFSKEHSIKAWRVVSISEWRNGQKFDWIMCRRCRLVRVGKIFLQARHRKCCTFGGILRFQPSFHSFGWIGSGWCWGYNARWYPLLTEYSPFLLNYPPMWSDMLLIDSGI